jgi:acyl dehydratase
VVAQALRFKQFGWDVAALAPKPALNGGVNGANITIPFSGPALVAGALTLAQWSATVNGVNAPLTSATAAAALVTVVLTTPATAGQTVRVRYVSGGAAPLKDASNNLVPSFNMAVQNNTP